MTRSLKMMLAALTATALLTAPAAADAQRRKAKKAEVQTGGRIQTAPINPIVGGAEMFPTYTIVQNATNSNEHKTLVKAVTAGGLAPTLSGPGPFTVFAPTDDAFGRLAPGMLDSLLQPEYQATLVKVLHYHVVPGLLSSYDIQSKIAAGGGAAMLTTVDGEALKATEINGAIAITDANGNTSYVTQPDIDQSNGIVHVVNGVLIPKVN